MQAKVQRVKQAFDMLHETLATIIGGARRLEKHRAHRALEQALVCVRGAISVTLEARGDRKTCVLDDPAVGLYIGPMTWHTMTWIEDDSVLLVLASDYYDEADYIRDYGEFLRLSARTP